MNRRTLKLRKPYVLIMGGRSIGYYKTVNDAVIEARKINVNRLKSAGPESVEYIRVYDDCERGRSLVHEEEGKRDFS